MDVPRRSPWDRASDQHGLDVAPGAGKDLHHAPGADRRCQVGLEAGFHPGHGTDKTAVDGVMRGPVVAERGDLRFRGARPDEDRLRPGRFATAKGSERLRPRDAVGHESTRVLKATEGSRCTGVEIATDGDELAAAGEEELQHRDVPPKQTAMHRPLPEQRPSEGPESASRRAPGAPVDLQSDSPLEAPDAAARCGAGNAVDRASVELVRA